MGRDLFSTAPDTKSLPIFALDRAYLYTLRELSRDETLSQRELAGRLGFSLGRVNYVVNSLIGKGLVQARRFKNSRNKQAYRYILTPEGISEKVKVTRRFLQAKLHEFERLQREIEDLRREAGSEETEVTDLPVCNPLPRGGRTG